MAAAVGGGRCPWGRRGRPGETAASTAGWLRRRLRLGAGAARGAVRTARALFRGPLAETAAALAGGAISPAHARVVADGTQDLPDHVKLEAELVLLEAAGRLVPPRLRQAVGHLCQIVDPDGADRTVERRHGRRGLWLAPTFDGMVAVDGLLEPEAGHTLLAALEPLARPAGRPRSPQWQPTHRRLTAYRSIPGHRARQLHGAQATTRILDRGFVAAASLAVHG